MQTAQFLDFLGSCPNLTHHVASALAIFKLHLLPDWVWNSPQPAPKALDAHLSCAELMLNAFFLVDIYRIIHIFMYTHTHKYIYMYIYIYME